MVTVFHFGDSDRPLVGAYHPPREAVRGRPAVLLCNPFGEEAMRAFRPLKRLADTLSREGCPTLRFDYFGAGDSAGTDEDLALSGMAESIEIADEELRDMSGVRRVVWVGVRLAARAIGQALDEVETKPARVILWDPVWDGPEYLSELKAAHEEAVFGLGPKARAGDEDAGGFSLSSEFRKELRRPPSGWPAGVPVTAIGGTAPDGAKVLPGEQAEAWNSDAAMNSFAVPVRTLDVILTEVLQP